MAFLVKWFLTTVLLFSVSKPTTPIKSAESSLLTADKTNEDVSKVANADEIADGEEIADDLSEISDEADDILAQQEVNDAKVPIFLFYFIAKNATQSNIFVGC